MKELTPLVAVCGGSGTPDLSKLEPEEKEMKRKKDEG